MKLVDSVNTKYILLHFSFKDYLLWHDSFFLSQLTKCLTLYDETEIENSLNHIPKDQCSKKVHILSNKKWFLA